jgi:hypothetical protein
MLTMGGRESFIPDLECAMMQRERTGMVLLKAAFLEAEETWK